MLKEKLKYRKKITAKHKSKVFLKMMVLSIIDYTIINVVQASHHQGDVRYGTSWGMQCSCISLISVNWVLFKSPGLQDKFNFKKDCILGKGDQRSKFICKFR